MLTMHDIQTMFTADHDRLDNLLADYHTYKDTDFPRAKKAFKEFKQGLQRHIIWEEQVLFPLFEQKTRIYAGGPTDMMRLEHRQIGAYLEALHQKVRAQDPTSEVEEQDLLEVLTTHNQKEESVLYPALDRLLTDVEKVAAFEAMERIPPDTYTTCCGGHR